MIILCTLKQLNKVVHHQDLRKEKFIAQDHENWIAIDNTTGDIWTESFDNIVSAVNWLVLHNKTTDDKIVNAFSRELSANI